MRKITVHYENKPIYDIIIARDFSNLAESVSSLVTGRKICVVTDSHVACHYLKDVVSVLGQTGNEIYTYTFEAGEENKNLNTVQGIYEHLILNHFDRNDYLVALGGGVVGDTVGYAAATYLRGISFIQIPTTLLAQVDSSIGGKTGVDFNAYKNMVGAFHMPKLVYSNVSTFSSLDTRMYLSGMGEVIKHGIIKDKDFYEWIRANVSGIMNRDSEVLEYLVYMNCMIKKAVVELDPKEKGDRALLNFGHTLGHAIEKLMNFKLYHGECVVLGSVCALSISKKRGFISEEEYNDAIEMFKKFNFNLKVTGLTPKDILKTSKSDKKMDSGVIKFILVKKIGDAYIDRTVTDNEILESCKAVLD